MGIKVIYENKEHFFEKEKMKVIEILQTLQLNPEEHIVVVNEQLYTEDRVVKSSDEIRIFKVTSSG